MVAVADGEELHAEVVLGRRMLAIPREQRIAQELRAERAALLFPFLERIRLLRRIVKIAGQAVELDGEIRRGLHVRLPAHGVDARTCTTHVAHEELQDGEAADVLHADRMLRHAQGIHEDGRTHAAEELSSRLDLLGRDARDIRGHLEGVAAVVLLHHAQHRVRREDVRSLLRLAIGAEVIAPGRHVIGTRRLVVAREQAVLEPEVRTQQAERIRIAAQVVLVKFLVLDNIIDDCSEEDDIRARTNLNEFIGDFRGTRITHIDMDDFRAILLGLHDILEAHRMALGEVRSLDPYELRIAEIHPGARHGTTAEGCAHGRWRRRMAYTRLVIRIDGAEAARHLDELVALLIVDLGAADEGDGVRAVRAHLATVDVLGSAPVLIACLLEGMSCLVDGLIPGDLLPVVAARCTVQRLRRTLFGVWYLAVAEALGAEGAAVDRTVRVAFEVDELAVLHRADDTAAAGTEVADRGKFFRTLEFELFGCCFDFGHVDTQAGQCGADAGDTGGLQECASA